MLNVGHASLPARFQQWRC